MDIPIYSASMLIDAFGPYADEMVNRFLSNVKLIRKKIFRK